MNIPESSHLSSPATGSENHPVLDAEGKKNPKTPLINHPSNPCKTLSGSLCVITEGMHIWLLPNRHSKKTVLPVWKTYLNNAHVQYIHIFVFLTGTKSVWGGKVLEVTYKELWKKEWQSFPVISWQSAGSQRRDILECVNVIIFTQLINIYRIY